MTKSTKVSTKAKGSNKSKDKSKKVAAFPALTTETRTIKGVLLPWKRVETCGPMTGADGTVWYADRPPKGTIVESGEVFIELNTLYELSEQDTWDSQFGSALLLGIHEGLALVEAGLAVQETRGGFHRTERLMEFIAHIENGN